MTARFPEDWIDQVRNSFNIIDFIGQYVQLRKRGRSFMGLCPFHSEKTPSFSVLEEKQIYHCFGCGEGGNIFTFLMKLEAMTFPETVLFLAESAGIQRPYDGNDQEAESKQQQTKRKMYDAYELVGKLYHYLLVETDSGQEAREYLSQRGIEDEAIEHFQLGFAPDSWELVTRFFAKRNHDFTLLQQAGILGKREYDQKPFPLFRNRLMFPITDNRGRIVAFGGRLLGDGQPKYLNSPEHVLFNKSQVLFHFYHSRKEIRKKKQAVLFEGYMDVIAARQVGVENGIATLGTSFTEAQVRLLKRNTDEVLICYDADQAGIDAALKISETLIAAECTVKIVSLDEGLDPDDYIVRYGREAFQQKLKEAETVTSFKMYQLKKKFDLSDESERMKYIQSMLQHIATLSNAVERDHYLRILATEFNYSLEALKQEQRRIYFQQKKGSNRDKVAVKWNNSINNGTYVPVQTLLPAYHNAEKKLITLMLHDKKWSNQILEEVGGNFNVDHFAALAAHLYNFYSMGNEADPSKFISGLEDQELIKVASQLILEGSEDFTTKGEIADYIDGVLAYPVWRQIDSLKSEQKQLERLGENLKAAQIGIEIHRLLRSLKTVST